VSFSHKRNSGFFRKYASSVMGSAPPGRRGGGDSEQSRERERERRDGMEAVTKGT
jgi:hypothetical protein